MLEDEVIVLRFVIKSHSMIEAMAFKPWILHYCFQILFWKSNANSHISRQVDLKQVR